MARPGLFDTDSVPWGWFDVCGQDQGWFDRDLLTAASRPRCTRRAYAWLVAHWTLRALPTAGSKEPTYWTDAARAVAKVAS